MPDEYYTKIAESYDELYGEEQLDKLRIIGSLVKLEGKTLDVGCGTGVSTDFFSCCIGLDPSEGLLEIAKKKYPNIEFMQGFAEHLKFSDKEFDNAISVTAAQNFSDMDSAVSEMLRVAKNIVVITILKNSPKKERLEALIGEKAQKHEHKKDTIYIIKKRENK